MASPPTAQTPSCPISMEAGGCGRPVHAAPEGIDAVPVCLMHSKDPAKHTGNPLYSQFFLEFKSILTKAGGGTADFTGFVFPYLSLRSSQIDPHCVFNSAIFEEDFLLFEVTFNRSASFTGATFQSLSCTGTIFHGFADFSDATFNDEANFNATEFKDNANFGGTKFLRRASFRGTNFWEEAGFTVAVFSGPANFDDVKFKGNAAFGRSTFNVATLSLETGPFSFSVPFLDTTFEKSADFTEVTFKQAISFRRTVFLGDARFVAAYFAADSAFPATRFDGLADFTAAKFLASASFRETRFRSDEAPEPGPTFALTSFSSEGSTLFYKTDLSHALFHNCDLSNVTFRSATWRKRPDTRTLMVFEEDLPLDNEQASTLRLPSGERDYGLIAQLYQQLKKNYDDRLAYWAANDFHFGEMEMKRLAVPPTGPLLKLRGFYHRHLSLIAWYRRGSSYGNSYLRPAAWLVGILLLFTLLYPLTGLQRANPNPAAPPLPSLTYRSVWPSLSPLHDKIWAEIKLLGKSSLATIDAASFQKNSEYVPTYPWGRTLAILETLLAATLFGLFLLAIRRQFRR